MCAAARAIHMACLGFDGFSFFEFYLSLKFELVERRIGKSFMDSDASCCFPSSPSLACYYFFFTGETSLYSLHIVRVAG